MNRVKPFDREEALKAEAEAYLKKLKARLDTREMIRKAGIERENDARRQAQTYLGLLDERAAFRQVLRGRIEKRWRTQSKNLLRKAEAYRKWLRRYLSPDLLDETSAVLFASDLLGKGYTAVAFRNEPNKELVVTIPDAAEQQHSALTDLQNGVMMLGQALFCPIGLGLTEALNVHNQNNSGTARGSDAPAHS